MGNKWHSICKFQRIQWSLIFLPLLLQWCYIIYSKHWTGQAHNQWTLPLLSSGRGHSYLIFLENPIMAIKIKYLGSSTLLLFNWKKGAPKIEKNVIIHQYTLSRNYLCQKIVKGGWQSWIFRDPLNSSKIGCLTKSTPRGPILREMYKCYTFSESSCQPQKGTAERKVRKGQEN